jgi:hypothetical protein
VGLGCRGRKSADMGNGVSFTQTSAVVVPTNDFGAHRRAKHTSWMYEWTDHDGIPRGVGLPIQLKAYGTARQYREKYAPLNSTHVEVQFALDNGLYIVLSVILVQTGSAKKNGMKATTSALTFYQAKGSDGEPILVVPYMADTDTNPVRTSIIVMTTTFGSPLPTGPGGNFSFVVQKQEGGPFVSDQLTEKYAADNAKIAAVIMDSSAQSPSHKAAEAQKRRRPNGTMGKAGPEPEDVKGGERGEEPAAAEGEPVHKKARGRPPLSLGGPSLPRAAPPLLGGPPLPRAAPPLLGGPPLPRAAPPSFGGQSLPRAAPPLLGGPPLPRAAPSSFGGQSLPRAAPSSFGGPSLPPIPIPPSLLSGPWFSSPAVSHADIAYKGGSLPVDPLVHDRLVSV